MPGVSSAHHQHQQKTGRIMLTEPTQKHVKCFVSAALAMTLAGLFTAPPAFARISANTIDSQAVVTDNGRHIIVTGPIACAESERAFLRVTVTQRETGAVAEGSTRITCTGDTQQWEVHASVQGRAVFEEGPATAVALAHTTDRGDITDAHQWLVDITLAGE
jgi:hypothetical protein